MDALLFDDDKGTSSPARHARDGSAGFATDHEVEIRIDAAGRQ
jgi:hypothetical protein